MSKFDMELKIGSDALMGMRNDADVTLQRLLRDMIEKNSSEATVSIGLKITLEKEWILDTNAEKKPDGSYPKRPIIKPVIDHKISSVMKIENKCNGENLFESYELVLDEERGEFVLRPIANTEQQTIFDDQYQEVITPAIVEQEVPMIEVQNDFEENMNPPEDEFDEEDEFEDFSDEFE